MSNIQTQSWLIDRRHVLRGLGSFITLPLLDCMIPLRAAQAKKPGRSVFIYLPNGVNTLDYQITSVSRNQTNLAGLRRTDVLLLRDMTANAWEYHYFELPDPPPDTPGYPAELLLIVEPESPGATLNDVEVQVRFRGCGIAPVLDADGEQEGVTRTTIGDELNILISAEKLRTEYDRLLADAQGCVNPTCSENTPGGACVAAEITTCALVASTAGARPECCFNPKIYIALQGLMPAGTFYTFSLQPELRCQAGFRAAGGATGTYAEACAACATGKFQNDEGQATCKS